MMNVLDCLERDVRGWLIAKGQMVQIERSMINLIKLSRMELKLSRAEFAEGLGISLGYLYDIESGHRPINKRIVDRLWKWINNDPETSDSGQQ